MTFWIIVSVALLAALLALIVPMMRAGGPEDDSAAYDLEVYRDQLAQIDNDDSRGAISKAEAEAARVEIARRMLAADARRVHALPAAEPRRIEWLAPIAIALILPLAAIVLYADLGAPNLPNLPFAERDNEFAQRKGNMQALVARLGRRLEQDPGNLEGWVLLARTYSELQQFEKAGKAYEKALGLDSGNAALNAAYGEALVLAANGAVTPASRTAFEAALAKSPAEPRARFYLAIADEQAGKQRAALDRWVALLKDSPADAPWTAIARQRAAQTATAMGLDPKDVLPAAPEAPARGPTEDDVAAARSMTPEQRQAMIGSMVQGLAERLKENPDDLSGWLRLGRAYTVLKRYPEARDAMANAARLAPENLDILLLYGRAIRSAADNKQTPESVAVMGRVLALDPDNIEALWLLGRAEVTAGDREAGFKKMQRALDKLPPDAAERKQLQDHLSALKAKGSK